MGLIAVIIIAVVFTGLSIAIAWAATQGKLSTLENALETQSRTGRQILNATLVVIYVGFAIAIPIIFLVNNHAQARTNIAGIKLTADEREGRMLFGEHCAVCHTLAAASAVGKTGPNLDQLFGSGGESQQGKIEQILHTVQNGCLQQPTPAQAAQETCLGFGTMPADIVQGHQAQQVAEFVARVAGHS